ncbi:MAG: SCO family protein [Flavobacteriaceae bacterium]|jgi:protein SCO1|nr:SCO family protein [Flavobacteriaceae bacterium]MDB0003989.1 SCO family protein [Flavobacteriaceae bacterium]MDG1309943.1 SCO family protein [Flavobacteriaceae bacterium]
MKKTSYSYVGVSFIILIFGIIVVPKIINRIQNNDVTRSESRSKDVQMTVSDTTPLSYLVINGEAKKVMPFSFKNQNGELISNEDYTGKVYLVEFFFSTCPTICPKMNKNLVDIQNSFPDRPDFGIASFTINPEYDTQEVLKTYADNYGVTNSNWHFMTGDKEAIYNLANTGFNLYAAQVEGADGGFEHSGNFALIDKQGYIRSRTDAFGNPKIYYKGIISQAEQFDEDGESEDISALKEDILKLLENE